MSLTAKRLAAPRRLEKQMKRSDGLLRDIYLELTEDVFHRGAICRIGCERKNNLMLYDGW